MALDIYNKILYSGLSTAIMVAVSNPYTYQLFDKLVGSNSVISVSGCPTIVGHLIHSLVFFILIFVVMLLVNVVKKNDNKKSAWVLLKYSFYATLLFFIITNTEIYKFVGMLTNNKSANNEGCPTTLGFIIHSVVFFFVVFGVMFFPKDY